MDQILKKSLDNLFRAGSSVEIFLGATGIINLYKLFLAIGLFVCDSETYKAPQPGKRQSKQGALILSDGGNQHGYLSSVHSIDTKLAAKTHSTFTHVLLVMLIRAEHNQLPTHTTTTTTTITTTAATPLTPQASKILIRTRHHSSSEITTITVKPSQCLKPLA